jgi:hypothetical protein
MFYLGYIYAFLLAAILVFGSTYLLLNWFEKDRVIKPSEKAEKVAHVLTTIFSIGMFVIVIGALVSLVYPLVGKMFGLIDSTGKEIIQQVITSAFAALVAGVISLYHIEAFAKFKRLIFTSVMGITIILVITLFIIFPAGKIRDTVADRSTINDLELIDSAIGRHFSETNSLPTNLGELPLKNLKNSLSSYTYERTSSVNNRDRDWRSSSRHTYKLCATFRTSTFRDDILYSSYLSNSIQRPSYSFYHHDKGFQCFDRTVGGGGGWWDNDRDWGWDSLFENNNNNQQQEQQNSEYEDLLNDWSRQLEDFDF